MRVIIPFMWINLILLTIYAFNGRTQINPEKTIRLLAFLHIITFELYEENRDTKQG